MIDFYRAFEDRCRGSRELIKSRLKAYLSFIEPIKKLHVNCSAIDLGCGRGEWLELTGELGFDTYGVDLDDGMLAACRVRGLNARKADAIKTLHELADESVALVSAFHVVEHMPFDDVQVLVREALRVLKPGGLLILETPNPENLVVGASSFYLDPSHVRPIPSMLLAFATEYAGFHRTKVVRLQESAELHAASNIGLLSVLNGVSPDYGVVAQKDAEVEVLSRFNEAFDANYGISLETLAQRYDQQVESRVSRIEYQLTQAETRTAEAEIQAAQAETRTAQAETQAALAHAELLQSELDAAKAKIDELGHCSHNYYTIADQANRELQSVYATKSWSITAPLRKWNLFFHNYLRISVFRGYMRRALRKAMSAFRRVILKSPRLTLFVKWGLNRYPRLRSIAKKLMGIEGARWNARTFVSLTSVRIMSAMSKSHADTTNSDSVVFLQVTNE